jgi:hypothetical protein
MTAIPYDDIVWACTNLCDLLEYENEALNLHDAAAVRELADNKIALTRIYEQAIAPMCDDPALAESLEDDQKDELTQLGNRLKTLVEENAIRLRAEMEARQMVMDAMIAAVKSQSTSGTHYGRSGAFGAKSVGEPNSLAFNKTL